MTASAFSSFGADPIVELSRWIEDARSTPLLEPGAMVLATASADGMPSARVDLYKGMDEGGILFFTNYQSKKGKELLENPRASLDFHCDPLRRQVRLSGRVEKTSVEVSDRYWQTRPRESQIGALASHQSEELSSYEELESRVEELTRRFVGKPIPRPANWGGFRLLPSRIEFWSARSGRLHERLAYDWIADAAGTAGSWRRFYLNP